MTVSLNEEVHDRFVEYRRTGNRRLRDELVEEHVGLAEYLARRFADRGEAFDDLRQVALVGLLKAVERFEPDRGLRFSTFATPTIVGELKRHFRDRGWAVRVPRRVQELHLQLVKVVGALSQELGRSPTPEEIARRTGTRVEDVLEAMEAGGVYRLASLDAALANEERTSLDLSARLGEEDLEFDGVENREALSALLGTLPPRERRIVYLRFFEGLTQSEIAIEIGISQMHVSRLLAKSLETLRAEALAASRS
ncbi:MAG: SigB/SigF/SigG family RNA polymerase sigma factor [Actinobacteria bacterium]|nr:SigB/SigF/SigG family RNA polymerase sigma factor [Actinomycetota bacterium]